MSIALLSYLAFLLYGSFFPFDFTADYDALRDHLAEAVTRPWDSHGHRVFSVPDVVSNILLGAPFGVLLVIRSLAGTSLTGRITRVLILDLVLAGAIEMGQLFAPSRTTSILDVGGQVAGSVAGAIAGHHLLASFQGTLGSQILATLHRRPSLAPLVLLVGVLAADALFPYAVTLDVSSVRESVNAAAWIPLHRPLRLPWHVIIVERVLPYTLLAGLLSAALGRSRGIRSKMHTLALGTALAAALEIGKLFIEGRSPNADHVLAATAGLLAGTVGLPAIAWLRQSPRRGGVFVAAAAVLMAYEELAPFDMVRSLVDLQGKATFIEWAPLAAYYAASPQSALFDAGKKLLLGGLFGSALCAAGGQRVLPVTLVLSVLLEAGQVITTSRHPSLTDVLLLTAGAAAGRAAYSRYRALTSASPRLEPDVLDSSHSYDGRGT